MYLAEDDLDQAQRHAGIATRSNPRLAPAWALQGDVEVRRNNLSAALAVYHRALSHQEQYPHVQLAIAELYRAQGRPGRALSTLDRLAQSFPGEDVPVDVLLGKGLSLLQLGRYEDAVDQLAAASRRPDTSAEVYYHLGRAELLAGRPANARWAVGQALALTPDHRPARQLIEQIDTEQRRMSASTGLPRLQ
jgi:tetratricopeptide (TPR) repeat protein